MKYANLYADTNGISHWKEVDVDFIPIEFAPPAPLASLAVHPNQTVRLLQSSDRLVWRLAYGPGSPDFLLP